jgi:NAD(P)-dependent dehydrogenase (short-subunit alcohol dehydrogenase family)
LGSLLTGKVAIVTGGAAGIGRGTVDRFVEEGAQVVIADVDTDRGKKIADQMGDSVAFKKTDVSRPEDVQAVVDFAVAHFGGLQVMFNNAGIGSKLGAFLDIDLDDFHRVMDVNLYGVLLGCQFAARHMKENGGGSIINNSSIAGIMGGGGVTIYRCAKAAVAHITKSIACDLGPFNIRVNCVAPGHIPTEITNYDMEPVIRRTQPFPRQGSVIDVANAVVYFASDLSAQVTGAMTPIDGGTAAGPPPYQIREVLGKG